MTKLLLLWMLLAVPLAYAETSLWEVSNGRHQVMIGGSLHLLSRDDYPLPPVFDQAYRIADKVYFQTDIGAINRPDFGMRVMQTMMYRDGRTLRSVLSPEVWQQLQAYTGQRNLPMASLLMFKPGFTSLTLTVLEGKRLGFGQSPDGHFYGRAARAGKPVAYLETAEQQLRFLDQLNNIDPDTLVTATLAQLSALEANSEQAITAWRKGDMAALDQLMAAKMRAEAPALYRSLVTERNRNWLGQIEAMLETPELEYVLVDALHLAGPGNLLQLLEAKGYTIKPLAL